MSIVSTTEVYSLFLLLVKKNALLIQLSVK